MRIITENELSQLREQLDIAEKEMNRRTNGYLEHVHDLGIERDELKRQVSALCGVIRKMTNLCRCPRVIRWKDGIDIEEAMHTEECVAARKVLEEVEKQTWQNIHLQESGIPSGHTDSSLPLADRMEAEAEEFSKCRNIHNRRGSYGSAAVADVAWRRLREYAAELRGSGDE
jgi:hypothetical protein